MHIVIDARVINSGTGTYVRELLNHLQQVDTSTDYTVLVPSKDIDYWKPTSPNFTVMAADFDNYSLAEQFGYKKFLESLAPDLVHFCMPQQPVFYRGRRVTTFHDMTLLKVYNSDKNWLVFHAKQLIGRWVWKRVAKISNHIIAISENTRQEYMEYAAIPPEKISVVYEAATESKSSLAPYARLPYKEFIMYVGQQPDYKNIRRLGEAHQQLLQQYPDLGLVLVGRLKEDAKRNQDYFTARGFTNIHFTDYIPDDQRDWLFTQAKAYVFPSLMEGFGLPPLEAMTYGTPVVSSNASCMPEILGDAPVYFDPTDINDMALKIGEVLGDEALRAQMIERGYRQVAKYSWERTAQQTHDIYMQVLKNAQ